jgi:hypothetical protein
VVCMIAELIYMRHEDKTGCFHVAMVLAGFVGACIGLIAIIFA